MKVERLGGGKRERNRERERETERERRRNREPLKMKDSSHLRVVTNKLILIDYRI